MTSRPKFSGPWRLMHGQWVRPLARDGFWLVAGSRFPVYCDPGISPVRKVAA